MKLPEWVVAYLVVSQIGFLLLCYGLLDFQLTNPMDQTLFLKKIFSYAYGHFLVNIITIVYFKWIKEAKE